MTAAIDLYGDPDVSRLAELESIIQDNRTHFYECGSALVEISESKLYKKKHGGKYATIEAYCKEVWGFSRPRAYQLIDSAKTVDVLSTMVDKSELTERLVRPLAKLAEPEIQRAAFQEARQFAQIEGGKLTARHVEVAAERVREVKEDIYSSIIKPTDAWNFSSITYGRIAVDDANGEERHGYIPGELYANCLWYYTEADQVVVAPMAGSGQIWRVWEDRDFWMRPESWDLDIHMFDLTPRGPYKDRIGQWDLTKEFPMEHADYIVMDIPYYGMVRNQYSDNLSDIANRRSLVIWAGDMDNIARSCARAQDDGGLCTVMTPNWRDTDEGAIIMTTDIVRNAFECAGYVLYDKAYASRRIQQDQGPRAAKLNILAKKNKTMLTDITEILTFQRVRAA